MCSYRLLPTTKCLEVWKEADFGYRLVEPCMEVDVDSRGVVIMSISLEKVAEKYLVAKKLAAGTRKEYRSTVTKWLSWGKGGNVDQIERSHIRDFLDWFHEKAANDGGSNAGRTANKARENLRAIMS